MAWGPQRDLSPEDVEKLIGVKPADLKAAVESMAKVDDKIATSVKTAVEGSMNPITESLKALETKLNAAPSTRATTTTPENNNDNNGDGEEDWLLDPKKATERTVNNVVGPVVLQTAKMQSDMVYNYQSVNRPDFPMYADEVKTEWDKIDVRIKARIAASTNPEHTLEKLFDNTYNMVRGRHQDEVRNDTNKREGKFFLEPGGSSGNTGTASGDKNKPTPLTDEEKAVAKKWGMKDEEYQEWKLKEVTYV